MLTEIKRQITFNTSLLQCLQVGKYDIIEVDTTLIPVSNFKELEKLNETLSNSEEFVKMVKYMGQFGGKDQDDAVRRILRCIMKNDIAMQLNWIGSSTKKSIKDFPKIIELVVAAVRDQSLYSDTSQIAVENRIKTWLRSAGDRDGGRNKRRLDKIAESSKNKRRH